VGVAGDGPAKYRLIADDVRARIRSGECEPGSRLPSKNELKAHYGVAGATLDKALALVQGLIETRSGVGMFVRDPLPEEDEPASEYETVMGRIDGLAEEVRRLRGEVAELKQAREA
jgi:DNA-binding GntR family transcriptional regulator